MNTPSSGNRKLRRAVKSPDAIQKNPVKTEAVSAPQAAPRPVKKRKAPNKKMTAGRIAGRVFLCFGVALILAIYVLLSAVATVANGPSATVRDLLVLSAMQASATKWVPGLFLSDEIVEQILTDSKNVTKDVISMEEYVQPNDRTSGDSVDEWANAQDGMRFETINGKTYKAYLLIVKDPSRIFVGTASDFKSGKQGMRIFDIAKKYNAVAVINGGEFADAGGVGTGDNPMGITFSKGELVWNEAQSRRTFIGIDKQDKLIVQEGITRKEALELGIRDGVCFQTGNTLITHEGENVSLYYADKNTGTAQRTAIGQRADGAILLLVTDGRSASSLGATHNDVIDIMVNYGAITAGMLDGGSSSMMYYENYYDKYDYDFDGLDQYQKQGLVNKYKAFTTPRRIPTYFIVGGESHEN